MWTSVENILDKRKIKKGRKPDPIQNFYEKRDRAFDLLLAARKSKNRKIIAEANDHFIIALVTAFEVYMADLLSELIAKNKLEPSEVNIQIRDFRFKDVASMVKNRITLGELYCNVINFDNFKDLSQLLNGLFGVTFFDYIKGNKFKYRTTRRSYVTIEFYRDFEARLKNIFEARHKIVHDISFRKTPTKPQLINMYGVMTQFVHAIEVMADKFRHIRDCEIIGRD